MVYLGTDGSFPSVEELQRWSGIPPSPNLPYDDLLQEERVGTDTFRYLWILRKSFILILDSLTDWVL